jgi:hypothetical protein
MTKMLVTLEYIYMHDIEPPDVFLAMDDDARTAHVAPAGYDAGVKLDIVDELCLLEVEPDGIVDLDGGIGVADGAAVVTVGDDVENAASADRDLAELEELVGGRLGG